MKKLFKKIFSVALIVLLLMSSFPYSENLIGLVASATNTIYDFSGAEAIAANYYNKADNFDFEEYLSTHFTSSPTIDLIQIGMNDATLVAPGFIEDLENNAIFKTAYGAWEVSTFIGNPGETIEKLLNRELYYETVLFRLLNSSIDSDNAIDWLNQGAVKHSLEFAKSLTDAADWDYSYDVSNRTYLSDLTDEELDYLNGLANNYVSGKAYTIIGDGLTFVENAMSVSSSVEEFSGRIGSYLQLANLSENTIEFLKILKSNTSNDLLSKALDTVIAVSNESFVDFMDAAAEAGAVALGKSAIKIFIGNKWKNLLVSKLSSGILSSGYTIVNGVLIANSLGQTISNVCFSVDKKLDHYELLKALVETEVAIKNTVSSILNSSTSGTMLSTALDLLYDAYALDCDLCTDLVNIMDKDWIQLSTTAQRNEAKANISTVKNYYSSQYNKILPVRGSCGKNLSWLFDKMTQELIIWGSGAMDDYAKEKAPWYEYKDSISNIHISSLCSQIGEYAFYDFSKLGTLVFSDIVKNDFILSEGCFDSVESNVTFIFTEEVELESLQNSGSVVAYALGDIYCNGPSYFKELYVRGEVLSSSLLSIAEGGVLIASTYASNNGSNWGTHLYINKNASVEIYGDAQIYGEDEDPFVDKFFDALTMQSGSSLNIYGDAHFCSGIFTANSGSQINISGNCLIGNGGICEETFVYSYGDMYIGNKLSVEGGYCSNVLLKIYGTVTAADFSTSAGAGSAAGIACLIGDMFITDESVSHDLSTLVMKSSSYLSVKGDAKYINNYRGGTYFTDVGMGPCVGTIELYNDAYFSEPGESDLNIILSGTEQQTISGYEDSISAGTFTINNTNGVIFDDKVTSLVLFNHKQNPFTLKNSKNTFQDYDKDGLLDNVDPYPLDPLDGQNNTDFAVDVVDSNIYITQYNGTSKEITIPNTIAGHNVIGITGINNNNVEKLHISENVEIINNNVFDNLTNLKEINVSNKNINFASEAGILYSKNKSILIRCPAGYENDVLVPDYVNSISEGAFKSADVNIVNCIDMADINLYHITSPDDLYLLSMLTNGGYSFKNKVIQLDCDISLNAIDWKPIGKNATYPFSGVLDGNNHTISGFNYVTTNNAYSGLFGYIKTGGVKDLTVEGLVSGNNRVGMFAGYILDSALYNCKAIGEVNRTGSDSYGYVGGLVGTALHSVIINCAAETNITANFSSSVNYAAIGGIAGVANAANSEPMCVLNSYCTGDITVSGDDESYYVGGIVGYLSDDAVNNYYYGTITDNSENSTKKIGNAFGYVIPEFTSETEYNGIGKIIVQDNYYLEGKNAIGLISEGDYDSTDWTSAVSEENFSKFIGEGSLVDMLNGNKTDVEDIIVAHRDILSNSAWAELVDRINGDSFTVSSWKIGSNNLPVNYECDCYRHTESDWVIDVEATCTKEGTKHTYCLVCQETVTTSIIEKVEHKFSDWTETKTATCTATGEEKRVCSRCDHFETITTNKLEHSYSDKFTEDNNATCTVDGSKSKHCINCDAKTDITVIKATGHNYTETIINPATCTTDGLVTYACFCGNAYTEDVPAYGHSDVNGDGYCDHCDENLAGDKTCSCNCHKTGIMSIIWKILRFFYKLFKINPVCECGVSHY